MSKTIIKVLFLLTNTLCGLITGLLLVPYGIAGLIDVIRDPEPWRSFGTLTCGIIMMFYGFVLLGFAVLGYCGAIYENKTMLIVYAVFMGLLAICDVGLLFLLDDSGSSRVSLVLILVGIICHAGITGGAVVLTIAFVLQCRKCRAKQDSVDDQPPIQ